GARRARDGPRGAPGTAMARRPVVDRLRPGARPVPPRGRGVPAGARGPRRGRPGIDRPGDRARIDPDLGVPGADAGALAARSGGGRPRPPDLPVLRQSDRRGGPRVSRDERALEAGLSDPAIPGVLATGELEVLGLLPHASNHTFLTRAKREAEEMLGVYKPR